MIKIGVVRKWNICIILFSLALSYLLYHIKLLKASLIKYFINNIIGNIKYINKKTTIESGVTLFILNNEIVIVLIGVLESKITHEINRIIHIMKLLSKRSLTDWKCK